MRSVWNWLTGKKTYIGAAIVAVAATAGFWFGVVDAAQFAEGIGAAVAIVGLGHKYDRQIGVFVAAVESAKDKHAPMETTAK